MKLQALTAAAFLLLAATGAEAACPRPTEAAPAVPNGATASEETMKAAHDALQAYVNKLENYKACLKDNPPADTSQEQMVTWFGQGDAAVDSASYLAADFSVALKQFKARQASVSK